MRTKRKRGVSVLAAVTAAATSVCLGGAAHAEKWPGDDAPIPGAIAARVIAVKCNGFLDPQAITELDSYIDRSATDFMAKSESNRIFAESLFPRVTQEYTETYSKPENCNDGSRELATDMLQRIRNASK
jgi:hypothetical protein